MLAAAPAPAERVEQDHDAIALEKAHNIMQLMYGEMPKGGSTQLLAMVQVCVLEAMSRALTPQPAPTAAQDVEGLVEALEGLMRLESRGRIMPVGPEWDAARSAIASHQGGGAK